MRSSRPPSMQTARHREPLASLEHAFTHFDLTITPLLVRWRAGRRSPGRGQALV